MTKRGIRVTCFRAYSYIPAAYGLLLFSENSGKLLLNIWTSNEYQCTRYTIVHFCAPAYTPVHSSEMTPTARQRIKDGFKFRFGECVKMKGSVYALSKAARVPIPTLRRYLFGSEPSLTILVAVAEAANVSVEWLATGRAPMSDKLDSMKNGVRDTKMKVAIENLIRVASK